MGRNAGSIRNGAGGGDSKKGDFYELTPQTVSDVAKALQLYSTMDKWNRNSTYRAGFNDEAMGVIEMVAKYTNDGVGTEIAKRAVNSKNWNKYGYKLSEKQAYVVATTALKHQLVHKHVIFDHYEATKKKAKPSPVKVPLSSTKTTVGATVTSKHGEGVITRIITKSSGYVEVTYKNGVKAKEMAFNLTGSDGRPLRNKPKAR